METCQFLKGKLWFKALFLFLFLFSVFGQDGQDRFVRLEILKTKDQKKFTAIYFDRFNRELVTQTVSDLSKSKKTNLRDEDFPGSVNHLKEFRGQQRSSFNVLKMQNGINLYKTRKKLKKLYSSIYTSQLADPLLKSNKNLKRGASIHHATINELITQARRKGSRKQIRLIKTTRNGRLVNALYYDETSGLYHVKRVKFKGKGKNHGPLPQTLSLASDFDSHMKSNNGVLIKDETFKGRTPNELLQARKGILKLLNKSIKSNKKVK